MKKSLAVFLGAGLMLSLAACGGPYDDGRYNDRHHHHHPRGGDQQGAGFGGPGGGQGMGNGGGYGGGPGGGSGQRGW